MFLRFSLLFLLFFVGCREVPKLKKKADTKRKDEQVVSKQQLRFLDEYILDPNIKLGALKVGGISGIDFYNSTYYLAIDDQDAPRVLTATIDIAGDTIQKVVLDKVIKLPVDNYDFYRKNSLDLESIVVSDSVLFLTSEGAIRSDKNPLLFQVSNKGEYQSNFQLPNKFLANSKGKPLHNATLEGLSKSYDSTGFWTAFELPLQTDGVPPSFPKTKSPIRITFFDKKQRKAVKEFSYQLSALPREPKGSVNVNGVTDILEYKKNHFFVIERCYQNGYKKTPNSIRIFKAVIQKQTTDVLHYPSLKDTVYQPMHKELVFDFSSVQSQLKFGRMDNIEGITFGPKLSNGNQSLILVSDDNFQQYGKQFNQIILMELKK